MSKNVEAQSFTEKHQTLWELIKFMLMSGITTVVDLGVFSILNYWLLTSMRDTGVSWWLFDYSVEKGGKCALLSIAISFAISQTVNFFIQRKVTFGATNNKLYSGLMYAVMVVVVYFFILWLPTLYIEPLNALVGEDIGELLVKFSTMTISAIIQFPMNKWVVMRKGK